jgi:hypothetical protein
MISSARIGSFPFQSARRAAVGPALDGYRLQHVMGRHQRRPHPRHERAYVGTSPRRDRRDTRRGHQTAEHENHEYNLGRFSAHVRTSEDKLTMSAAKPGTWLVGLL